MLYAAFYQPAALALAALQTNGTPTPVALWLFAEAPTNPGPLYATYQTIGPGGRRWVFEGGADYARVQVNVSALKTNPAALATIGAAFEMLDTLETVTRLGPPLPLPAPETDPYKTMRAEYEVNL